MNLPDDHDDDLDPIARRLAAWTPAPARSGRDRILYEAGVAAGRRQARWQQVAVAVPLLIGSTGWIRLERAERNRLELALAARSAPPQPVPTTAPIIRVPRLAATVAAEPMSYLALSHRLDAAGSHPLDPIDPDPDTSPSNSRGGTRSILTPLSSRRPAAVAEL